MDTSLAGATNAAAISGFVSLAVALVAGAITMAHTERRTRQEFKLQFAAERIALQLLKHSKWKWRTFRALQIYIGGFEPDELRRILVRAGAVRSQAPSGEEVWGLYSRNPDLTPPANNPYIPTDDPDAPFQPGVSPERPPADHRLEALEARPKPWRDLPVSRFRERRRAHG